MTNGDFLPIDERLANFLVRHAPAEKDVVRHVVRLLSRAVRLGNICLPLSECGGVAVGPALRASGVVGEPGSALPLILDVFGQLYLSRFRHYEEQVARFLREEAAAVCDPVDWKMLDSGLARLFGTGGGTVPDGQREAAVKAVCKRVSVVSGGPGTGKTTTVVKMLALLLEQAGEKPLDIALAAPTGKGAARLKESVAGSVASLDVAPRIQDRIPREASTIHRLLGAGFGGRFSRGPENPLPFDVVVVDEASMIDLPMMARLVSAMPGGSRLILLGDKDQLASVEAGTVFADICKATGPFAECVSELTRNYRFGDESPIALLSSAIRAGRGEEALERLRSGKSDVVEWADLPPTPEGMERFLRPRVLAGFSLFLGEGAPEKAFEAFGRFRILSAHREGIYGVSGLNELVEKILSREGFIRRRGSAHYPGRPILILRNDHALRLSNGDTGIVLRDPSDGGKMKAFFPPAEERHKRKGAGSESEPEFRTILLTRLPEHETAWATTVHKSQGAEFDQVLLVLGPSESGLVIRELLYTGITRARTRVTVVCDPEAFTAAVARPVDRRSGLIDLLAKSIDLPETPEPGPQNRTGPQNRDVPENSR
jgi:exodeoxyribonuclease V alpha subunit